MWHTVRMAMWPVTTTTTIIEDMALMKEIGLKSYWFSISWPRVLPQGIGEVNQAGLDFYINLVDELIAAGIEPLITLYH